MNYLRISHGDYKVDLFKIAVLFMLEITFFLWDFTRLFPVAKLINKDNLA